MNAKTIEDLNARALARWVPAWLKAFRDDRHGGFHERLDAATLKPLDMGYKRLLTQCRQIYVYSHAAQLGGNYRPALQDGMDFLVSRYHVPQTGGWRFSVTPEGSTRDNTYDLYGHAFVLLCMGFYHKGTGDAQALAYAKKTLEFIDGNFRTHDQGFAEALGEDLKPLTRVRRQNPHMHFMEACLFMFEVSRDPAYLKQADELYGLFKTNFTDPANGTLIERFKDDLRTPDDEKGSHLETGHHFEWIWLLDKYAGFRPEAKHETQHLMKTMYDWANTHGRDKENGGFFNELDTGTGKIVDDSKRIWHICEALKADALMQRSDPGAVARFEETAKLLRLYVGDDGAWTETRSRDLTPQTDFLPGTTAYHIFMGVAEAHRILTDARFLTTACQAGA